MEQEKSNSEVKMEKSSSFAFKGIAEVFYDPASLFKKVKDSPTILVPYIVLLIISLISAFLLIDLIVDMQVNSPEFVESLQGQPVTDSIKNMVRITTLVAMPISLMLIPLITAGLALFFGNFVFGGKATYKQLLSTMLFCEILFFLGGLITIPMALAKGSLGTDLSLGFLAIDQGMQSVAWVALSKISLFHIWEIIVAGIGLSVIYDFPRNKGYILAVLSIGLLSIVHIGTAAIGAMFN